MFFWLVGPLVSLSFLSAFVFFMSWRNQNSPLVKKEDRWQPPSRRARAIAVASFADFDPNAADNFPLADYAPGVIVPMRRSAIAPIIPLPQRADIVRFPLERIEDPQAPPPPPKPPAFARRRPRLRLLRPNE